MASAMVDSHSASDSGCSSSSTNAREPARAERAIDDAVVARHRDRHALADDDLTVLRRPGCRATAPTARMPASGGFKIAVKRSMPNMPRFDTVNVEPVISWPLSWRFFARVGEVADLGGDRADAFLIGVEDHRRDETVFDRDRDADVHAVEHPDRFAGPCRVAFGHATQRERDRLDDEVVDGDLAPRPASAVGSFAEQRVEPLAEAEQRPDVERAHAGRSAARRAWPRSGAARCACACSTPARR